MNNFEVTFPDGGYVEYTMPKEEVNDGSSHTTNTTSGKISGGGRLEEHKLAVLKLKLQVRKGIISGKQAAIEFLKKSR
jgi:hypothetical protein